MVPIRSFGFLLGFILVLIGESTAHSQVMKRISVADHGSGVQPARKDLAKLVKEVYDAVPAAAEVGNTRLEGRKMMLTWGLDRKAMAVEGADGAESAKISGKGRNALNKQIRSAQEKLNQDDRNLMKVKFLSCANPKASRKHLPCKSQLCSQNSKPVSLKGSLKCLSRTRSPTRKLVPKESDHFSPDQKLQSSKKPLEAAKELLNVMATDYTGPTAHKPPIHN